MDSHGAEYRAADLLVNGSTDDFIRMLPLCKQGVFCIFDQTFERGMNGLNFLGIAAEWGLNDAIRKLVKYGVDVDMPNIYGSTPLMIALSTGQLAAADTLLELGANQWKRDYDGRGVGEYMAYGRRSNPNMDSWAYRHGWTY